MTPATDVSCRFCEPNNPCRFHRVDAEPTASLDLHQFRAIAPLPSIDGFWQSPDGRIIPSDGYQTFQPRQRQRDVPAWYQDAETRQRVIGDHPQAAKHGERWQRILYLYFQLGWSSRDIADELDASVGAIEAVLRKLRRRADKIYNGGI
jgi:hypothetical protein